MVVDFCKSATISESDEASSETHFDNTSCQATGNIPPFNEYLNVNTPLQLGGLAHGMLNSGVYRWQYTPIGKPFNGCIRNLVHNSVVSSTF